ncbi:MAG: hypothetical protein LBS49_05800 [Candidatus Accumulibacter sp.]|jgi:hypothetical protein|nr:hypothetical protein [Accumulibacter sp.]
MRQTRFWLATQFDRLGWEIARALGRLWRCFGLAGALAALLVVLVVAAALGERWQMNELDVLQRRIAELERSDMREARARTASRTAREATGGRSRLRAFEAVLLPHDDVPVLLQNLLRVADEEGVALSRGEYRVEPDTVGGFLRYRMELPLQGPAPAVYRFIARALAEQRALALRSVHFRRARIDAADIEARVQWIVLTNTPSEGARPARLSSGTEG